VALDRDDDHAEGEKDEEAAYDDEEGVGVHHAAGAVDVIRVEDGDV